ncbi:carbamoyl-phosphate synthase L chain, ATP binding domain-containing protein [Blastocladiella britannica]|nr:carbamoyl-phosphate synthase L chain, ATP binding domain-containing protein [Blastocladiella britannica]
MLSLRSFASRVPLAAAAMRTLRFSSTVTYPKTFDKILIANRGEIACRVMKTAKKMNIKTVAVYSEADANAQHVQMADEAVCVGPAPTSQSYLSMPNILAAIKKSGAQAVHPGYGFLSENSHFVEALDKAGVTFIGPATNSMAMMGDKIESKRIAIEAGVNTIPGFQGEVKDVAHALQIANDIGYPLMIKASAGGGGKGMRVVRNDKDVRENFDLIKSESLASFGDDRLLMERFVENPRHIEIQLIGDKHGNIIYLPERECSIQRRNQKVIEEAPSVHLDEATRRAMGEQAVALAKRVGYYSAGTVEFLVDPQRNFFFLEMNTRLQVEHPITELITGLDLVENMIRVAADLPLPFTQDDIKIHGHAIESRVYAEDPEKYLPSIGTLSYYTEPTTKEIMTADLQQSAHTKGGIVRCDSGVEEGSEISIYYDPMICKLSTWAPTREGANTIMQRALDAYVIKGVTHNIPLMRDVLAHPRFVKGALSTGFLPEEYPQGFKGFKLTPEALEELVSVSAAVQSVRAARERAFANYAVPSPSPRAVAEYVLEVQPAGRKRAGDAAAPIVRHVAVRSGASAGEYEVATNVAEKPDVWVPVKLDWTPETPIVSSMVAGAKVAIVNQYSDPGALGFKLQHRGTVFDVKMMTEAQARLAKHMKPKAEIDESKVLIAPMPGQLVSVSVKAGDEVTEGTALVVVEAMKMQNVLRATRAGTIKKVHFAAGASVAADDIILEFEDEVAAAPKK